MSFSYDAKEVLLDSFLDEYQNTRNVVVNTLERLHINRFVLDRIRHYPVAEILEEYRIAISMIFFNSIEICILLCTKLLTDGSDDFLTLRNFRTRIFKNLKSEALKKEFTNAIREIKKKDVQAMEEKLSKIRSSSVAHLKNELVSRNFKLDEITWNELDSVIEQMNRFAKILTFNQSNIFLDTLAYHPEASVSPPPRNDFVAMLEAMEDRSSLIDNITKYELTREIYSERMSIGEKKYLNAILERNDVATKI